MDVQEQLDRSIGAPRLRVDIEQAMATGRAQQRRRRALAGGATLAVLAGAAGGAWAVRDRDSDLQAAEQETVSVSTCTAAQLAAVNPADDPDQVPVLVTGASAVCLAPTAQLVEQIDRPITGKKSIALRLGGLESSTDDREFNVVVVWGAYGLSDAWAVPVMDIDWGVVMTGAQGTGTDGFPQRPLADYVAALNADGLPAAPGREQGWTHCASGRMGGDALVAEVGGTTCVAEGYEVLDRRNGKEVADEFLDTYGSALSARERTLARAEVEKLAGATGWELLDRDGRVHYLMVGAPNGPGTAQAMPMRVPMPLIFGLFASGDMEVSSGQQTVGPGAGTLDEEFGVPVESATATATEPGGASASESTAVAPAESEATETAATESAG